MQHRYQLFNSYRGLTNVLFINFLLVSVAVDGGWSDWKNPVPVSDCSVTCGSGTRDFRLSRTCDNPPPSNGGKPCAGRSTSTVTRTCNTNVGCPGEPVSFYPSVHFFLSRLFQLVIRSSLDYSIPACIHPFLSAFFISTVVRAYDHDATGRRIDPS